MKKKAFLGLLALVVLVSLAIPANAQDAYRDAVRGLHRDVTWEARQRMNDIRYHQTAYDDYYGGRRGLGLTFRIGRGDKKETIGECLKNGMKAMKEAAKSDPTIPAMVMASCTGNRLPAVQTARPQAAAPTQNAQSSPTGASAPACQVGQVCLDVPNQLVRNNTDKRVTVFVNGVEVGAINAGKPASFAKISEVAGVTADETNIKFRF